MVSRCEERQPIMKIAEEAGYMDDEGFDQIAQEDNERLLKTVVSDVIGLGEVLGIPVVGK